MRNAICRVDSDSDTPLRPNFSGSQCQWVRVVAGAGSLSFSFIHRQGHVNYIGGYGYYQRNPSPVCACLSTACWCRVTVNISNQQPPVKFPARLFKKNGFTIKHRVPISASEFCVLWLFLTPVYLFFYKRLFIHRKTLVLTWTTGYWQHALSPLYLHMYVMYKKYVSINTQPSIALLFDCSHIHLSNGSSTSAPVSPKSLYARRGWPTSCQRDDSQSTLLSFYK